MTGRPKPFSKSQHHNLRNYIFRTNPERGRALIALEATIFRHLPEEVKKSENFEKVKKMKKKCENEQILMKSKPFFKKK